MSSNQKLPQMQEYTHVLMQLGTGSPPYVPYDVPVPHACKQVLNTCPIETMNIIVLLLSLSQRLSTDKWQCHMEAPLVCTIHGANHIIHIVPLAPFRPSAIPNENIRRCPGGQRTNPNDVTKTIHDNRNFIYAPGIFRIKQDITKNASYESDGHVVNVMRHKIRKVWDVVPLRQPFRPSNFSDNTIQVRTNTMHTCPPSLLTAPRWLSGAQNMDGLMKGKHAQINFGAVGAMAPHQYLSKPRGGGGGGLGVSHTRTGPGRPPPPVHTTKRGLSVLNPNSRGHATKRGL